LQEIEDFFEKIKCIGCKMYVYKKVSRKDMGMAVDSGFHSKRRSYSCYYVDSQRTLTVLNASKRCQESVAGKALLNKTLQKYL